MINTPMKDILGTLLIITSIFDAIKYSVQAHRIRLSKSSKNLSRKFINFAIGNDIVKMAYGICIVDPFIIISSVLAIICMLDYMYSQYLYYPYRCRGLVGFKRPSLFIYFINSLLPNQIRKRL